MKIGRSISGGRRFREIEGLLFGAVPMLGVGRVVPPVVGAVGVAGGVPPPVCCAHNPREAQAPSIPTSTACRSEVEMRAVICIGEPPREHDYTPKLAAGHRR